MPGPDGVISLALDFDGSLVEGDQPLRWRRGAKEFIRGAAAAGIKLVLFSCRCAPACGLADTGPWDADDFWRTGRVSEVFETSWRLRMEMRAFLEVEGVWTLMTPWELPGKPLADIYADDKADLPDWLRLAGELGVHLLPAFPAAPLPGVSSPHAEQGGPGQTFPIGGGTAERAPLVGPLAPSPGPATASPTPDPAAGVRLGS